MKKTLTVISTILVIALISVVLFACVPSNVEKASAKMQEADYLVVSRSYSYEGAEGAIYATRLVENLIAIYFDSTKSAKAAYEDLASDKGNENLKQNGKWVYFGTKAAIEAFEK